MSRKKCGRAGAHGLSPSIIKEIESELNNISKLVNTSNVRIVIFSKSNKIMYVNETMRNYLKEQHAIGGEESRPKSRRSNGPLEPTSTSSRNSTDSSDSDIFTTKILQLKKDVAGLVSLFPEHTNSHARTTHIKSNITFFSCYEIEKLFTLAFFALYDRDMPQSSPLVGGLNSMILHNLDSRLVDDGMNNVLTNLSLIIGKILASSSDKDGTKVDPSKVN